jgi:Sec-independent protein translocase protein TatA
MRFEASLKELQKAVKNLEKASKSAAKSKSKVTTTNQIDMFSSVAPSNDIDVKALKKQLDEAISSVETLIKESA